MTERRGSPMIDISGRLHRQSRTIDAQRVGKQELGFEQWTLEAGRRQFVARPR
jgi:hypothetical protein